MKRNYSVTNVFKFFALSIVLTGIFAFGYYEGSESRVLQNNTIPLSDAKSYYQESTAAVKSVYLDDQTVSDMSAILKATRGTSGVRVYFGSDSQGNSVSMLVTVTDGKDNTDMIVRSGVSSPCPNMCDADSQISK